MTTDTPNLIEQIVSANCGECLGTGIAVTSKGPGRCTLCHADEVQFSEAAARLAVRLWVLQDKEQTVDPQTLKLARLLTHATFETPLQGRLLREHFNLSERDLKSHVESLRAEWVLPIGSHRQPPYGYYWMRSPEEFQHWLRTMRAQAMRELVVAYRLFNEVYPELAGQESFDFANDFSSDLQEALK